MTRPAPTAAPPETWLFLALGGLAVAWPGVEGSAIPDRALVGVLAVAMALAGLPHGALDPWVAWRAGLWRSRRGFMAFHLGYVAIAAGVVAAWWFAPGPSLVVFLVISAWHFAGDWRLALPTWARAVAGVALLTLPAWRWPAEVAGSFIVLAGPPGAVIAAGLAAAAPWLAVAMVAVVLVALRRCRAAATELTAVAALALLLPPLVYFIVYFCALHSLRHLRLATRDADATSRRRMAGVALVYTALTLLAAAMAWPWLVATGAAAAAPGGDLLRLVFIGLAALTLPHMLVVMLAERGEGAVP